MRKIIPFLLTTTLIVCKTNFAFAQIDINDSLALVDLYDSTNGSGWYDHTNWLTTAPVSSWYGVGVSNNRVGSIILQNNNVSGKLPTSLGNLSALVGIQISGSHLTGKIPSTFSMLTNLHWVYLGGNQLTGHIPSFFGNLVQLTDLSLGENQFTGKIPSSLGNLTLLWNLDLENNHLTGEIPSSLQNLTNIRELYLDNNSLSGNIPPWFGNFTKAEQIWMNHNQFTGDIPDSLGNLTTITILKLNDNQLSGPVPETLIHFVSYTDLSIYNNYLTFDGIEYVDSVRTHLPYPYFSFHYSPQANIPITYNQLTSTLSVSAGGTLKNNTYKWYRNGALYKTIVGDSTFIADSAGAYHVEVTNYFATQLTLISNSAVVTPATVSILKNISVTEGNTGYTVAKFKILLNHATTSTVKVNYTTKDGTAQAGLDYVSTSGTLTFKPGKTSKVVTVNVIGDNTYESNEKFSLVLSNPVNALLGTLDSATCTIKNDDPLSPQSQISSDAIASNLIKLFPNPARDELKIEGLHSTQATIAIMDVQGRKLIETTVTDESKTMNVKQLSAGVYYLRIQTNGTPTILKFIKQ